MSLKYLVGIGVSLFFTLWCSYGFGQDSSSAIAKDTSAIGTTVPANSHPVVTTLDSALNAWQSRVRHYDTSKAGQPDALLARRIPHFSDEFFQEKIDQLDATSPIDYTYNQHVKPFITLYASDRRNQVERMLGLSKYYFPIFASELDRKGLPLRLKYLPVIESALNPHAVSSMGANGLWQFMYATAKYIGLDISTYIDERRDPHQSTKAAVRYLSDLHDIYEDWLLVIAAYNCGPGNVNRAIRHSGYSENFWDVYPYLPRETRGYVPAFIAATHVMEHHEVYRLYPSAVDFPFKSEQVSIEGPMALGTLAKGLDMPVAEVQALNPAFKRSFIPGGEQSYDIKLPREKALAFNNQKNRIYALQDSLSQESGTDSDEKTAKSPYTSVYYTVKRGDNLGYIAEWFDCSASDLRRWNNMRGSMISPGEQLKAVVPTDKADIYKQINDLNFREKQYFARTGQIKDQSASTKKGEYIYHEVQPGETLWGIAQQYESISVYQLKQLNNIRSSRSLKPGQQLKVQEKG
jgi:membrane-bound lytic murein transglycosylase D